MDYIKSTLEELLKSKNNTVRRNAISIYKELKKINCKHENVIDINGLQKCLDCELQLKK